jgi:hypothetical protein
MNQNLVGSILGRSSIKIAHSNQKQELPVAAMFVNGWNKMSNLYKRPSIDASYQVSVHLAEGFQRRRLKTSKLGVKVGRGYFLMMMENMDVGCQFYLSTNE